MQQRLRTNNGLFHKSSLRRRNLRQRLRGLESLEPRWLMAVNIGDYVWFDANQDGTQNEAASFGVNNVAVSLFTSAGLQVDTTKLTANDASGNPGFYGFEDVAPGNYYIVFTAPVGQAFTLPFASDASSDSNADRHGKSNTFSIVAGAADLSIDAGLVPEARIGDYVWWDQNADGLQADTEPGIAGATVKLFQGENQIATAITDSQGQYAFNGLPPGTYSIQFDYPAGFNVASPSDVTSNVPERDDVDDSDGLLIDSPIPTTADIVVRAGDNNQTIDQGFYRRVSIGDYVWRDVNMDGIQNEAANFGVNGVTVTLFTEDGIQVDIPNNPTGNPTITANDGIGNPGYYLFANLDPGQYFLRFTPPAGQVFTTSLVGDYQLDSDADILGQTETFGVLSGFDDLSNDAGLRPVDLSLTATVNNAAPSVGTDVTYEVIVSNASDFSAATGVLVKDVVPDGLAYNFDTGSGTYNSLTREWSVGTLAPGESKVLQVVATVITGGTKTSVTQIQTADQPDFDSTPGNAPGVHEDDDAAVTITPPSASIGNYVWRDVNNDGVQNEATTDGINGITVTLFTSTGNQVGTPVVTANDGSGNPGYYQFVDINPGSYFVIFTAPADQTFTTAFAGASGVDSNADSTGKTNTFTLESGVDNRTIDAGLSSVGGTCVYLDLNNGNNATSGTPGNIRQFSSGGVAVKASGFSRDKTTGAWANAFLGGYSGGLGVTDTAEGTGANNTHTIDNLDGRDNYVLFEFNQQVVIDTAYLGYVVNDSDLTIWIGTVPNAFNNHQTLSDSLLAGLYTEENLTDLTSARLADLNAASILGNVIIIAASVNDTSPEDRFKIGQLKVCTPGAQQPASLGDFVWHDLNGNGIRESVEPGIAGAAVTLTGGGADGVINGVGDTVVSTTTNSSGNYSFAGLVPGTQYRVTFALPAGYSSATARKAGSDPTLDSDGLISDIVILGSGENNTTVDAGYYKSSMNVCVNLFLEGNTATSGTAGNVLTFSSGGISAKASAFSRDSNGKWSTAYLGRYSGGLGVTDKSEGNGSGNTHTVDNLGSVNYVLFEFSQAVTVDTAFLGYVVGDSDLKVWIGNAANAFNNHYTLSDTFLTGLGFTEVNLGAGSTRTADINAGNLSGNILVLAANTGESKPNDQFKIAELGLCAMVSANSAVTKFFTVDDDKNKTFKYGSVGNFIQDFGVSPQNPRGITSNVTGSNVWIADYYGRIYNYTSGGTHVANWNSKISGLQGVTTNGTHIWTVSETTDRVYYYVNGTKIANGASVNPSSSFALNAYNKNPKGLTTDGKFIWVVNDGNVAGGTGDMVFKYTVAGKYLGRWQLDPVNGKPTGITVDPAGGNKLWLVDSGTDRIYEYSGATGRISGGVIANKSYALAAGNSNPQGIADPPGEDEQVVASEASLVVNEQYVNPDINPSYNSFDATDVNGDGATSPLDALIVINRLNASRKGQALSSDAWMFDDVSNDGAISPLDALLVINQLNKRSPAPVPLPDVATILDDESHLEPDATEQVFAELGEGEGESGAGRDDFFADYAGQLPMIAVGSASESTSGQSIEEFELLRRRNGRLR